MASASDNPSSGTALAAAPGTMTKRRSAGKMQIARALWYARPGVVELRAQPLRAPRPDEARVRTLYSGVSRGTERLILQGQVPASEWQRMRAPMQEGEFPFPVKYGYAACGVVEDGPDGLTGTVVFALHPHQSMFVAPTAGLVPVPAGVPPRRAVLAANMETALNAHWDAGTAAGDRVVVIGAGVVGLLVASLAARLPGADVTVVDLEPQRAELAEGLRCRFCLPSACPTNADVVFHTSGSGEGLATALAAAGPEARIVELSWYGERPVTIALGGAFHSGRLRLVSSQVGQIGGRRRARWSHRRRLEKALELLAQPELDLLVSQDIAFEDTPKLLPDMLGESAPGLAPVIRYPGA